MNDCQVGELTLILTRECDNKNVGVLDAFVFNCITAWKGFHVSICFGFVLLHSLIGWQRSRHFLNQ